ncbi:MAG: phosphoribosylglycinamide formyltransferase [Burkholderiaceae bacterium]
MNNNITILISGRGSNMEAIIKAHAQQQWPGKIAAVLSNRPHAQGLRVAAAHGIATHVLDHTQFDSRDAFDAMLAKTLEALGAHWIVLAGFMRVLTTPFVERFAGRLINIHPSLLPAFPGLATHRQALAAGVRVHGCTVHFVTPDVDGGPIIAQAIVPVLPDDTEEMLESRVRGMEHKLFPQIVRALTEERVGLHGRRVILAGMPALMTA